MSPEQARPGRASHIVFGSTGGIGSSLVRKLVARGDQVLLVARNEQLVAQLGQELELPHSVCDCTDAEQIAATFVAAKERFGEIYGVAHCVGSVLLKPAHLTSGEEFLQTLQINLVSAFHLVQHAVKAMPQGGSIVLFSSAAARIGLANHEAIAAAKAGVEGLARSAAMTYANRGLRINCLAPGLVRSKITERIWSNPAALQTSQAMHPLGAPGEPDCIAEAAAWLLSTSQTWITGQTIAIDGGLSSLKAVPRQS
jgi:NAD(P)-dependent dehydrogenase (short-subunit alcohol dehydrogenase family)